MRALTGAFIHLQLAHIMYFIRLCKEARPGKLSNASVSRHLGQEQHEIHRDLQNEKGIARFEHLGKDKDVSQKSPRLQQLMVAMQPAPFSMQAGGGPAHARTELCLLR
jgi:hypothetical protein